MWNLLQTSCILFCILFYFIYQQQWTVKLYLIGCFWTKTSRLTLLHPHSPDGTNTKENISAVFCHYTYSLIFKMLEETVAVFNCTETTLTFTAWHYSLNILFFFRLLAYNTIHTILLGERLFWRLWPDSNTMRFPSSCYLPGQQNAPLCRQHRDPVIGSSLSGREGGREEGSAEKEWGRDKWIEMSREQNACCNPQKEK